VLVYWGFFFRYQFMSALPIEIFGHRVIAKIGTGAASEVYVVQDLKTKQVWALKHVIRLDDKSDRFIDQVEKEFEIGSKLQHENIRGIHKILRTKKSLKVSEVGLLMELVDADTLDLYKPKNILGAAKLLAQVARGLEHMNSRGFVHSDMKPINVMVMSDEQVKIIDLGQACAINEVKKRIQGTPGYIAPEQAHLQPITAQTDVYNFGAMVYVVLTGEVIPTVLPPQIGNVSSAPLSIGMVKMAVPLHKRNFDIPEELSNLVQECIQLKPEDRVQGMRIVAERMEVISAGLDGSRMGMAAVGTR